MAFSQANALDAARTILRHRQDEAHRLNRIAAALKPEKPWYGMVPPGSPPQMTRLAERARTNYLPLVVKNLRQTMIVEGYRPAKSQDNAGPWAGWQANGMDARQAGVHNGALAFGFSYVTVTPGDPEPLWRGVSPRRMTAMYADPLEDDWPIMALRVDDRMLRLYDEEQVYYIGNESPAGGTMTDLRFIEARAHGLGVCPVVRFRDRMLDDEDMQLGVIEPLLQIQERIDETVFGLLVTQYFQAFLQRYVIGWEPETTDEKLKARASELWTFADPDVKVGAFPQADLSPLIASKESAVGDMATIAQIPKSNLGVGLPSNTSAEALAASEAQKDREVREVETSLGESWEQVFRLSARASGDEDGASDTSAQVRWKDATARSLAQTVDALGKMAQMLGVPTEALWERIPDVTDTDISTWKALRDEGNALGNFASLLGQQDTPPA